MGVSKFGTFPTGRQILGIQLDDFEWVGGSWWNLERKKFL